MENAPPRIRPGLVTAIALVTWLAFAWTLFTGALLASGILPNTIATQLYFAAFTRIDWVILWLLSVMLLAAVTLLWFMRREALWWFMASAFLGVINSGRFLVAHGPHNLYATLGPFGTVVSFVMSYVLGLVVSAAVLAYVVSLYRRGALG